MKLFEVAPYDRARAGEDPIFAWLEPARGPEDISGVRLAFVQPIKRYYDRLKAEAQESGDDRWLARLEQISKRYEDTGQQAFTPDLGWWMSKEDFYNDDTGFGGVQKSKIAAQYPRLHVMKSRDEAFAAAKKAGLFN